MGDVVRVWWLAQRRWGKGMLYCLQGRVRRSAHPLLTIAILADFIGKIESLDFTWFFVNAT